MEDYIDWREYGPTYSTSPNIKSLGNLPIFEFDQFEQRYLWIKKNSKKNFFVHEELNDKNQKILLDHFKKIINQEWPKKNISFKDLYQFGNSIQEDFVIVHKSNKVICLHVSMPSGWEPKDKLGKTFGSIHKPVVGMEKFIKREFEIVNMMINAKKPLRRYVWGEHTGHQLSEIEKEEPSQKVIFTERQTILGLPEYGLSVFLIKKKVCKWEDTSTEFKKWYFQQIESMSPEQKRYKGIN